MKRLLRWTGMTLATLVTLIVVAYLVVYLLSEHELRRTFPTPAVVISIPADAASIAAGLRLAQTRGCFMCHGKALEGNVLLDEPMLGTIVAPNLTSLAGRYDAATLAAVIRNGVRPDGRSMMVMPSMALRELNDADLGRLVAYVRSLSPLPGPAASITVGPLGRIGVATGKFKTVAQTIAEGVPPPPAASKDAELGYYVARSGCAECHGVDLRGADHGEFVAPTLQIVNAYDAPAFTTLMRTGIALGGRTLGQMTLTAKNNLTHLTDAEIDSLYTYLHTLPDPPTK